MQALLGLGSGEFHPDSPNSTSEYAGTGTSPLTGEGAKVRGHSASNWPSFEATSPLKRPRVHCRTAASLPFCSQAVLLQGSGALGTGVLAYLAMTAEHRPQALASRPAPPLPGCPALPCIRTSTHAFLPSFQLPLLVSPGGLLIQPWAAAPRGAPLGQMLAWTDRYDFLHR